MARAGLIAALVSRIFGRLVGIVLVVLVARVATDETVAIYGYLLGTSVLMSVITDLGVAAVAGREVAARRLTARDALWLTIPLQALSILVASAATVVLVLVAGPDQTPASAVVLTAAFVVFTGFVGLWGEILRADGKVYAEAGLQMFGAVFLVAGGVMVVELGGRVTSLMAVVAAKELIVLLVSIALIRPRVARGMPRRQLLGQSLHIALASTVLIVLWRQGMVVAGTGSVAVLAGYVVASRYLDALLTVAQTASIGLLPGMSALADDPAGLRRTVRRYLGLALGAGLAVAVVGTLLARPLTVIPFGERWAVVVPAVRALCLVVAPLLLAFTAYPILLARHQTRLCAVASIAATAVGVVVSVVLFRSHQSVLAPMVGTAAGIVVLAVVQVWGLRDLLVGRGDPPRPAARDRLETEVDVSPGGGR